MKKKIIFTILSLAIVTSSFFIGKESAKISYQDKCDFMSEIVDWNTDGEELAVFTKDGYEFYTYKSDNVYENKNFIPVEEDK